MPTPNRRRPNGSAAQRGPHSARPKQSRKKISIAKQATATTTQPAPRKNTKLTGERSEAAFLTRAVQLNFGIAKPWGDSRRYDFILDNGECLHRIQVKCTESIRMRAYETRATYSCGKGRAVYTKKDIDFIAAHVVPLDLWYIVPVEVCTPAPMLRFYPHRKAKRMRLEPYREAWHLVLPKENQKGETTIDIQACAEETPIEFFKDHVGTAAPGCPPSEARQGVCGAGAPARDALKQFRQLCKETKPTSIPQSAAPWPVPRVKVLATRVGKRVLPT